MIENGVDETKIKDFSNSNGKDIAGISEDQWQKLLGPVKGITIYNAISKLKEGRYFQPIKKRYFQPIKRRYFNFE